MEDDGALPAAATSSAGLAVNREGQFNNRGSI
jgi:hypothetical protein